MILARNKVAKEHAALWDEGYEIGHRSRLHSDQFLQTQWNKKVLFGNMTYFEFKAWEAGYWSSRRDAFWGLGRFDEWANENYDD